MRVRAFLTAVALAATVAACGGSSSTPSASAPGASEPPASSAAEQPSASTPAAEATPTPEATTAGGGTIYVVKKGDTLWGIAQKYHTTVKAIQDANPSVTDPTKLKIGTKLTIP